MYDRARPVYPEQLFDDLAAQSGISEPGRILEIGPGTGQATLPLARRGYRILALELGPRLTQLARKKLAPFSNVEIRNCAFEDWEIEGGAFDIIFAATAFHWIRPVIGFSRAAAALKSGGFLALVWNFPDVQEDDLHLVLRKIYQRYAPDIDRRQKPEARIRRQADKITGSGHFLRPTIRRYPWRQDYCAEEYINLLRTQSNHILLGSRTQQRLYAAIRELIASFGDHITRQVITALFLSRRKHSIQTAEQPASLPLMRPVTL